MRGINKVILVGNLGKDPEVRSFEGGNKKASFSLATSETYLDKTGNRTEKTEWHNIVTWNKQAEIAEKYLKKGNPIYVEGKIRNRTYQDKDNQTRYITEIAVDRFVMLGGGGKGETSGGGSAATEAAEISTDEPADDLPF